MSQAQVSLCNLLKHCAPSPDLCICRTVSGPKAGSLARQVSEDPLDNPRFLCNIPEALARLLAANIDLDLNTYLLYA